MAKIFWLRWEFSEFLQNVIGFCKGYDYLLSQVGSAGKILVFFEMLFSYIVEVWGTIHHLKNTGEWKKKVYYNNVGSLSRWHEIATVRDLEM